MYPSTFDFYSVETDLRCCEELVSVEILKLRGGIDHTKTKDIML